MWVKVCGMTNLPDALAAGEAGADAVGFVLVPSSPRMVTRKQVFEMLGLLPSNLQSIGVVANEKPSYLTELMRVCPLDGLQFHGEEPPEDVLALKASGRMLIKAIRVKSEASLKVIPRFEGVDAILLDSCQPGKAGGTGKQFDWSLVQKAKSFGIPIILAGGLRPANVQEAIEQVRPYGVDVVSGVEISPGWKDHERIRRFIQQVRSSEPDPSEAK